MRTGRKIETLTIEPEPLPAEQPLEDEEPVEVERETELVPA